MGRNSSRGWTEDRTGQDSTQLLRRLREKESGEFKGNLGNFTGTLSQNKEGELGISDQVFI